MKLLFVIIGLIGSSTCFAVRYAVVFNNSATFSRMHSQWNLSGTSVSSRQLKNLLASAQIIPAECPVHIENSLVHLRTFVVSLPEVASDSTCAQIAQTKPGAEFQLEKEVIYPTPKLQSSYELTPAWNFDVTTSADHLVPSNRSGPPANNKNFSQESLPWGITAVRAPEAWAMGQRGHGARVMVLDTGVDQNHPVLKGQIEAMKDFVNDENSPYPAADHVGHGTHVSGTILGRQSSSGFSGVAPEARLLMGRVCSENGCSSIDVIQGVNWAIEQKVDVLNLSLGSDQETMGEKSALANAEAAGIIIVAASGNGGTANVGFPAAYSSVLAVGAVDSDLKKAPFSQWGPEMGVVAPGVAVLSSVPMGTGCHATVELTGGNSKPEKINASCFSGSALLNKIEKNLLDAGLGKPADFDGQDFTGHFALISRGEISFTQKVSNALNAHAAGVVFINNQTGLLSGVATDDGSVLNVPIVMIEQAAGAPLHDQLKSHPVLSLSVQTTAVDYASFDGTSMASPHVAGVMALVRAAHPKISPLQARNLLKKTAKSLSTPAQTGAGLVDAQKAVTQALQMQ